MFADLAFFFSTKLYTNKKREPNPNGLGSRTFGDAP